MSKRKKSDVRNSAVEQRYVNILTNGGFKAFFGDPNNKTEVIDILNALLPEHRQVVDIDYLPTEYHGQTDENKEFHYDFMCRDTEGVSFIVEAQRYKESDWFRRCVSYASRIYDIQNESGGDYDYDIPPVYLIGLMGVDIDHPDMAQWRDRYISEYTFREKETHELLDETIFIIFAELTRFNKSEDECISELDRMLYVLKNSEKLKKPTGWLKNPVYARILRAFEIMAFSKTKRIQYNKDMYDERRRVGEMKAARQEGREEGREEGLLLGARQTLYQIARNMLAKGMSVSEVSELTSLTEDEIRYNIKSL